MQASQASGIDSWRHGLPQKNGLPAQTRGHSSHAGPDSAVQEYMQLKKAMYTKQASK